MMAAAADRATLSDVVHRYAAGVDDRQFDAVVALFTETAELILPDPPTSLEPVHRHRGRTEISAAIAGVATVTRTEHAIVGEVYLDGSPAWHCPRSHRMHRAPLEPTRRSADRRGLARALRRRLPADRCGMANRPPRVDDQRHRDAAGAPVAVLSSATSSINQSARVWRRLPGDLLRWRHFRQV